MEQVITAPSDRAVRIHVFEPSQRADQAERPVDEFELKAGESKPYNFETATAAYRSKPLTKRHHEEEGPLDEVLKDAVETMQREDEERLKTVERGAHIEQTEAELAAGADAHAANSEFAEDKPKKRKASKNKDDEDETEEERKEREAEERSKKERQQATQQPQPRPGQPTPGQPQPRPTPPPQPNPTPGQPTGRDELRPNPGGQNPNQRK